jgi:hypothetical protein
MMFDTDEQIVACESATMARQSRPDLAMLM